jgi:hypothetical protein
LDTALNRLLQDRGFEFPVERAETAAKKAGFAVI